MMIMRRIFLFIVAIVGLLSLGFTLTSVEATEGMYFVSVTGSFDEENLLIEISGQAEYGKRLKFETAIDELEEYEFAFWIVNGRVRCDLEPNHEFIVNGPMEIEAVFSRETTYAVVFLDSNGKRLSTQYIASGQSANPPLEVDLPDKPGLDIDEETPWNRSYESITEHTVLTLQYQLSSEATFMIEVTNGTGAGVYDYNSIVTVVADEPSGDDHFIYFLYWADTGEIVSYNETYKFTALQDRRLEAIYGEVPSVNVPLITLSEDLKIRTNHASYVGQFSIPEGHTLIEYGILRSDSNPSLVHDSVDATRYRTERYCGSTGEFLSSFATPRVYQRAYLVSEDLEEVLHFTYSNVVVTETYSLNLSANHEDAIVDVLQATPYFENDITNITASDVPGHNFLYWYDLDNDEVYTTIQNPTLEMNRDFNLEARYEEEDSSNGDEPDDYGLEVVEVNFKDITLICIGETCTYENDITVMTLRADVTSNIEKATWKHQLDGGYVIEGEHGHGNLSITDFTISKPTVTILIELSISGSLDDGMMVVFGASDDYQYMSDVYFTPLEDTGGKITITHKINNALEMTGLMVMIPIDEAGITVDIYSVSIYEDD